jgi:hypothetical protein
MRMHGEVDVDAYARRGLHKPDVFRAQITPESGACRGYGTGIGGYEESFGDVGGGGKRQLDHLDRAYIMRFTAGNNPREVPFNHWYPI